MECTKEKNLNKCNCSYVPCPRKGRCCECLHYHRQLRQLPACFFYDSDERSYDRSLENFMNMAKSKGMRTD